MAKKLNGLSVEIIRHLIYNYGSEYAQVLRYIDENPDWKQTVADTSQVIKAEVIHGIREEMAEKLADVVLRRTDLGSAGDPGDGALKTCAALMAKELDWDAVRVRREIEEVKSIFSTK